MKFTDFSSNTPSFHVDAHIIKKAAKNLSKKTGQKLSICRTALIKAFHPTISDFNEYLETDSFDYTLNEVLENCPDLIDSALTRAATDLGISLEELNSFTYLGHQLKKRKTHRTPSLEAGGKNFKVFLIRLDNGVELLLAEEDKTVCKDRFGVGHADFNRCATRIFEQDNRELFQLANSFKRQVLIKKGDSWVLRG